MRIGIFVNTPAQWHFWKNIGKKLRDDGNEVKMLFRDYGETLEVIEWPEKFIYSSKANSKFAKMVSLPLDVFRAYKFLRKFKPDTLVGFGVYEAFTSAMLKKPSICFEDSEPSINRILKLQYGLYSPFLNVVITPESFLDNLGKKQIRIASYKEMAYLHPNYYKPKDDVLELMGISKGEDYVLLRFNAFSAIHDIGISGFTYEDKIKLVKRLEKYAKVFISSEAKLPKELEDYALKVSKKRIHDVIYHAKLFVSETGTMTTESAVLGTPAILCHKFAWKMGNFKELEKKYGLIFNYPVSEKDKAIEKAIELVQKEDLKKIWQKKREKLLEDKIDITAFMVWFIENYPESFKDFKENPEIQYRFR